MDEKQVVTDAYTGPERREHPEKRAEHEFLRRVLRSAFVEAIEDAAKNDEVIDRFWRKGFERLSKQASTQASEWVGKRILTAAVTAVFGWALYYLVKNGAIK